MKSFAVPALLALALCSAGAQSLRSQIEVANRTIGKLMVAKDLKALKAYMKAGMTPNFQYVEAGKSENFEGMWASMAMGIGGMKSLTASSKTLTLKEKGDAATATTLHTMVGTLVGGDKKPHGLSFTGTSTDSYVKQGGKWKMSKMAWGKQTTLMDGKPMPGM